MRFHALRLGLAFAVIAVGAAAGESRGARPALACSLAPPTLEGDAAAADLLILADVVAVGGAENEQPPAATVTPTSTYVPDGSPTPTATPERRSTEARRTATPASSATAAPIPTSTLYPSPDLTGLRAELAVVEMYIGAAAARVTVDAEARARYERGLREVEARYTTPICGPFSPMKYELGARYLVIASETAGEHTTVMRVRVEGADAVLVPNSGFYMKRTTYDRYFAGVDAELGDDYAFTRAERIPVATLVRAYRGLRSGEVPIIVPPNTGSAGLAAGR